MSISGSGSISGIGLYEPDAAKYADNEKDADELRMDFMTTLIAQLENQDPLEPMENAELTSQMAQMSTLEAQQQSNVLLEQLIASQGSGEINQAVSYIGKEVMAEGNKVRVENGQGALSMELNGPATVNISIYDGNGAKVREASGRQLEAGQHTFNVNDPIFGDTPLADGSYTFSVAVEGAQDGGIRATTMETGMVNGVNNGANGVELDVNGHTISVDAVRRVQMPSYWNQPSSSSQASSSATSSATSSAQVGAYPNIVAEPQAGPYSQTGPFPQ